VVEPFIGIEALAAGVMTRHQLRTRCRPVLPGVYLECSVELTLQVRARAAWLWSKRQGVLGGPAAAALLGAKWVDDGADVDLYYPNTRPPTGVRTHHDRLPAVEQRLIRGMGVITAARTAFDLARRRPDQADDRRPPDSVVAAVDALLNASRVGVAEVAAIAGAHPRVRGLRQVEQVLRLVDAGAESTKGTWLRLLINRHGLPPPQTQVEVRDEYGIFVARLDMGWPDLRIAVEYDGDQHRTNRRQYVRDMRRREDLDRLGWIVVRVVAEDLDVQVVRRIQTARARAFRFTSGRRIG
jgi:very-short-patch-repair endonuclease